MPSSCVCRKYAFPHRHEETCVLPCVYTTSTLNRGNRTLLRDIKWSGLSDQLHLTHSITIEAVWIDCDVVHKRHDIVCLSMIDLLQWTGSVRVRVQLRILLFRDKTTSIQQQRLLSRTHPLKQFHTFKNSTSNAMIREKEANGAKWCHLGLPSLMNFWGNPFQIKCQK